MPFHPIQTPIHDAAGDVTSDGRNHYLYDAEGRICAESASGASVGVGYLYDAAGNRVAKGTITSWSCNITLNHFVQTTGYVVGPSGEQWTDLIYGPTGLLAEVPGNPAGTPVYRVTDHLGSTTGSLLSDGTFVNPVDYTPFGRVFSGSTSDPYLFTGYERDGESGLDYASARHYASYMGRFMSPDPSGLAYADQSNPQSFNLYSYVLNNPLVNTDPTGMYCYYGSTDADVGDDSQYDMHSTQKECTAKDENGNQGQWIPDPTTNVTVNANGDGSVDTDDFSFDGMISEDFEHSEWQGDPDNKRIQQLAVGVTVNSNHSFGCIAQAYGFGGPGEAGRRLGQPVEGTKRFITPGSSRGTSPASEFLRDVLPFKGRFTAPVGGLGTGRAFQLAKTPNLGAAIARYVPFVGLALDAISVGQLTSCLSKP